MKIQLTKNGQYIITLPKALVEAMGIKKGIKAEFRLVSKRELLLTIKDEKKR